LKWNLKDKIKEFILPIAELEGANIYFERKGYGETTYVFCHGLGSNGIKFENEDMDWYANHFDVVSWDNRGLGRSGSSGKYSLPLYATDLKNLLQYLNIEKAIIFGVSWGGVLTQKFATMFPEMCSAIVLDSTSSEVNQKASENWYARGEIARLGIKKALAGKRLAEAFDGHRTASNKTQPDVSAEHLDSYVAQCRATAGLREHPLTHELASLVIPALIVGAGNDAVAGAAGSVILNRTLKDSELHIFQEANHGVYATEREGFRQILIEYLKKIDLI